jgi:hypothetical protein
MPHSYWPAAVSLSTSPCASWRCGTPCVRWRRRTHNPPHGPGDAVALPANKGVVIGSHPFQRTIPVSAQIYLAGSVSRAPTTRSTCSTKTESPSAPHTRSAVSTPASPPRRGGPPPWPRPSAPRGAEETGGAGVGSTRPRAMGCSTTMAPATRKELNRRSGTRR